MACKCIEAKPEIPYRFSGLVNIGTTTASTDVNVLIKAPTDVKAFKLYTSDASGNVLIEMPSCFEPSAFYQGCYRIEVYDTEWNPIALAQGDQSTECILIEISSDCEITSETINLAYIEPRPCGCIEPCVGCAGCGH